jgi:Raf kinase inhibitor-like YbhB/YbcL family protein
MIFVIGGTAIGFAQQNPPAVPAAGAQAAPGAQGPAGGPPRQAPPPFTVMSNSITDSTFLATKYTCTAGQAALSPELHWMNPPRDAVAYVLIVHDMEPRPRKGVDDILHWMVWNIPASATTLPEAIPNNSQELPDGSFQTNGNPGQGGISGYRPPCPPAGPSHHYAFELFAVDQKINLPLTATRADVMKALDGHISAHASIVVPYHQ